MAFWNKKKKEVPEELPDLISDDIEKTSGEVNTFLKEEEKKTDSSRKKEGVEKLEIGSPDIIPEKEEVKEKPKQNFVEPEVVEERSANPRPIPKSSKEIVSRLMKNISEEEEKPNVQEALGSSVTDKSFFNELQENLEGEIEDLSKFEEWYENKFLPEDILSNMRKYWEQQKTKAILNKVGKDYQEKISFKVHKLQELERVWQSVYFELVEKEEEIKENEAELKKILKEFVGVCREKKKSFEGKKDTKVGEEPSKDEKDKK